MKKIVGFISIAIGIVFLLNVFSWATAETASQQLLKWTAGGFGCLFVLAGAYSCVCQRHEDAFYDLLDEINSNLKEIKERPEKTDEKTE